MTGNLNVAAARVCAHTKNCKASRACKPSRIESQAISTGKRSDTRDYQVYDSVWLLLVTTEPENTPSLF